MAQREKIQEILAQEKLVTERIDKNGNRWTKKYFGGGAHFENWLSQCEEVYGKENVDTEEIDSTGFKCFENGDEKMYRIWVKERS